jgi:hypothetical protein
VNLCNYWPLLIVNLESAGSVNRWDQE